MNFTPLEKDMNIISALDDEPNDMGGLTAAELKAKFDEGGKAIKEYLNSTMIPEAKAALQDKAGKEELHDLVLGMIPDGTITADKLSEELKKQIDAILPASDVFTKKQTLSDETAAMYGLDETAVPDDVFKYLVQMVGDNWYSIQVQLPDGTPVPGCKINGLTPATGSGSVITNSNGYAFGKAANSNPSLTAVSPYFDYSNVSASVPQTSAITSHVFTLTEKALSFPIQMTGTQKVRFSPKFGLVDMFLVGGGGSGAICRGMTTCSTGGGGGFTQTVKKIDLSDKEVQFTIGSGGSPVSSPNHSTIQNSNGNYGGATSVVITGGQTYSVNGGGGGLCRDGGYNTSAVLSVGPATGGGKSAAAYINNTATTKHGFTEAQNGTRAFGESSGDVYGSGGGAYIYNSYEEPGFQGGVNGGIGAGGYTLGQNGIAGTTYGSGGGPGCSDNYGTIGGKTCTSGAGKQGVVMIRKAVI